MTITERMKNRPTYAGLPVPYSVIVDANGVPDFKVTDLDRWRECVRSQLCALCGERLDYWVWYIGGASCADQGVYADLAMHEECAFYAASVCPFLQGRDYAAIPQPPAGYTRVVIEVKKGEVLYASKRRRDQVEVVRYGDGLVVKTGPEIERVQIYPQVGEP